MLIFLENFIFILFCFFTILSAIFVLASSNAVKSALFLICTYVCSSILLFILNLDFLALLFLIVYIGAIVVLFIFVIMMIDLADKDIVFVSVFNNLPLIFISIILCIELGFFFYFINNLFSENVAFMYNYVSYITGTFFYKYAFLLTNLPENLGLIFFTDYLEAFVLVGILLVVVMVGSISITVKHRNIIHIQQFYLQYDKYYENTILI